MSNKDRVAELMSEGLTPEVIGLRLGIRRQSVNRTVREIRRDLGPQAI